MALGRLPVSRWHRRTTRAGHIAANPNTAVSFPRKTGRSVTCDRRPQSTLIGPQRIQGAVVEIAPEVDVALAAREDKNATQAAA